MQGATDTSHRKRNDQLARTVSHHQTTTWRLVIPLALPWGKGKSSSRFRVEKTTLVPYMASPFTWNFTLPPGPLPLVDVILGPGSDENSVFAAQEFLNSQGLNLKPRLSKVPYRPS
jgi:hypothetical protein